MKLQIINYDNKYDKQLIDFFYRYVFFNRDEFEYTRPGSWFQRYIPYESPIIKLAKFKNSIIGTIGILPTLAVINKRIVKGGYFVDNCASPEYIDFYSEIMSELYTAAIIDAKQREYEFIAGWDYLKNFRSHRDLYSLLNFSYRHGANWFVGGLEYKRKTPKKWHGDHKVYWGSAFFALNIYNYFKRIITPKKMKGISTKLAEKKELKKIAIFLNKNHPTPEFRPHYTSDTLTHLWDTIGLRVLTAEKNNEILGVITFTISTWTGMMYGKPFDTEWEEFRTITPDEFIVSNEWTNTELPIVMVRTLLDFDKKYFNTGSWGYVATIFDREIEWMCRGFKKAGFLEARADFGVFMVKSLNDLCVNTKYPWSIPARAIIAPYPNWIKKEV